MEKWGGGAVNGAYIPPVALEAAAVSTS